MNKTRSLTTREMIARAERRIAAHKSALDVETIIADHEELWREYITIGVFSQRRTSYETAMQRLEESRQRFGEDHYQRTIIGFALRFKLYPSLLVD